MRSALLGLILLCGVPHRETTAASASARACAGELRRDLAEAAFGCEGGPAFHHLHLNDSQWPFLLNFYGRLFDSDATTRFTIGDVDALRSGSMLMLINRASSSPSHASAIWHFGWGTVSLGESYLAHAGREVAWDAPLPPHLLHLHLLSVTPSSAAAWYRDVLGARVELPAHPAASSRELPPPEHRVAEALVWIGDTGLLIYRTAPPLLSTRGQRADHFAIAIRDFDQVVSRLRERGVPVSIGRAEGVVGRSAMIEGPDQIAIEIVEAS